MNHKIISLKYIIFHFLLYWIFIPSPEAKVVYVNDLNIGTNITYDGLSWDTAYRSIQTAMEMAETDDEIWVASPPQVGYFILLKQVSLYGGFRGTETNRNQRDWTKNPTLITGTGEILRIVGYSNITVRVDGFVFKGGVTGIKCNNVSTAIIANNTITRNSYHGIFAEKSNVVITNNIITGNGSNQDGGGILITAVSRTNQNIFGLIADNTIVRNVGKQGGGIACLYGSSPDILRNLIMDNHASLGGGGVYFQYGLPIIGNNRIIGNLVGYSYNTPYGGGGISFKNVTNAFIYNNNLIHNITTSSNTNICVGAGIRCDEQSTFNLINNTFIGNNSEEGANIYSSSSNKVSIINNIFTQGRSGIFTTGPLEFHHNCIFNNGLRNIEGTALDIPVVNNITNNPLVEYSNSYGVNRILSNSPCINAGDNNAVSNEWKDIDGQQRIQFSNVDIGADEYDGVATLHLPLILYVSPIGNDLNDGSSWLLAKRNIQSAIDKVAQIGGEVRVKEGLYNERLILRPFTYLYGGFNGNETMLNQRSWLSYPTIIDAQYLGCVVNANYVSKFGAIDGFVLRNGTNDFGGGISCSGSQISIRNNTISNNVAMIGGGISCTYNTLYYPSNVAIIANNSIIENKTLLESKSALGGGVHVFGTKAFIANNNISYNRSKAGNIFCQDSELLIINNTILCSYIVNTNSADVQYIDGGILCNGCEASIINNIIAYGKYGVLSVNNNLTPITYLHNCVYGNSNSNYVDVVDPTGTNGNISLDPQIMSADNCIFLKEGSPCYGSGLLTNIFYDLNDSLDLYGHPRINNGQISIGAVERVIKGTWKNPTLMDAQKSNASVFGFKLECMKDFNYQIQMSTNLMDWQHLYFYTNGTPLVLDMESFRDQKRFYRVRLIP